MPFKSEKQRKFLFAKKPEVAKKFVEHSDNYQSDPGDNISNDIKYLDRITRIAKEEKAYNQSIRPNKLQTTLREFQDTSSVVSMSHNQGNVKNSGQSFGPSAKSSMPVSPKQGQTQSVRGTQQTRVPTQAVKPIGPVTPTGGQPMSGNKNPMKQITDNVSNNVNRSIQGTFNTGPNKPTNQTGLGQSHNPFMQQKQQMQKPNPYANPYMS